jgi:general secretion pathway protein M
VRNWFDRLTQREQLSVLLMALAVGLYLVYVLLLSPLGQARDRLAMQNQGVAESLQRVDVMVSQIMALRDSGASGKQQRNLTTLINRSTAAAKLQVSRLQPNSRGEIQVRLEAAAFDDLMGWLYQVEHRESLLVREVSITQAGAAGRVNATIRLAQAG